MASTSESQRSRVVSGVAIYHRNFIKGFARFADPLYRLTVKHSFLWREEHQEAFEALKKALATKPALGLPNSSVLFILETYASKYTMVPGGGGGWGW